MQPARDGPGIGNRLGVPDVSAPSIQQIGGRCIPAASVPAATANEAAPMALRPFLLTLACAAAVTACSATVPPQPLGATCDAFRTARVIDQSVVIAPGGEARIVLCSNPTTGYTWGQPHLGDATVLQVVDRMYQAPAGASLPIAGAGGAEILTVRALAAGTTTLSLSYGQPWAGGTKGEWTYTLTATVQ